jgi:hypothetical protein
MSRKLKPDELAEAKYGENTTMKDEPFYAGIAQLLITARQSAYRAVNSIMVQTYWHVGQRIVEREQQGQERADYGERLIVNLSRYLSDTLGKGFSEANIKNMRQFYLAFPNFQQFATHRVANLAWSHLRPIMRLDDGAERQYYLDETSSQNWSVRTLERNIKSGYYRKPKSGNNLVLYQDEIGIAKQNIAQHVKNILPGDELAEISVVKNFFTTASDSKNYNTRRYNLKMTMADLKVATL